MSPVLTPHILTDCTQAYTLRRLEPWRAVAGVFHDELAVYADPESRTYCVAHNGCRSVHRRRAARAAAHFLSRLRVRMKGL